MKRLQITDYRLQIKIFVLFSTLCFLLSVCYALEETGEEIKLYLGEVKVISVSSPQRIAIGNPNIADVTNVTKNEITLSPKSAGSTTLVVWDNFGEQSYSLKVFGEDITEIKRRIDNLLAKLNLPEVYTQAQEDEGKIMLLGRVKSAKDRETISVALGPLKEKTVDLIEVREEESVVEIDVEVLELNKDATDTLGFSWPDKITLTEKGSPGIADAGTKWSALFKVLNLNRAAFSFTLDALVQEGKVRVLSRPRLACQSGKEAELLVGGEKPIFTTTVAATTGASGTSVQYKEFGIKLKIKPTVTDEERIKLALNVEVSEVGTAETIGPSATSTTAKAYPLSKRTASTELFLNDGQIMAIGGLMKQKTEEDIRKTPWLGDVPVLGLLFRKKTTKLGGGTGERGNTELFITLTPKIIREKVFKKAQKEIKPEATPTLMPKNLPEPIAGYSALIQKRILDNLTYPSQAKQAGFQGTVKVSLHLSYTGKLLAALVKDPSGYQLLDDHALSIARGISPYPPFPSSVKQEDLWIDIPIHYKLD